MADQGKQRASGETGAAEEAREAADAITEPIAVPSQEHEESRRWRTPGFQRMRYTFRDEDQMVVTRSQAEARRVMVLLFADAYAVMHRIYEIVRDPVLGENNEPLKDAHGFVIWQRQHDGWYVEDFSRLSRRQREDFLGSIVTALFNWEQQAAMIWSEAMYAKALFEERFAIAYDAPLSGTVDDRRAAGNKDAAEERYFAIYMSTLSKMADGLVRSMDRLQTRLKDILVT